MVSRVEYVLDVFEDVLCSENLPFGAIALIDLPRLHLSSALRSSETLLLRLLSAQLLRYDQYHPLDGA